MNELIITYVELDDSDPNNVYPITHVRRIEFDSKDAMHQAVIFLSEQPGVTNSEFLEGESMR